MPERETWTSRAGFIAAAVGSAVGLGNIWGFPFQAGRNGGAAFVLVYLIVVLLIGLPAMMMEFSVGRKGRKNPIDVFRKVGFSEWRYAGAIGVFIAFWILAFYSVVGGWVIHYIQGALTGAYITGDAGAAASYFVDIAMGWEAVGYHLAFMAITAGIVAFGVEKGIERSTKIMVPSIIILLAGLAVWVSTLSNAGLGYDFYIAPELGEVAWGTVIPYAVGQAFFTLSLGMGAMLVYSSYLGRDDSLPADSTIIVIVNTLVAVLAGFVVFPVLFHSNPDINLANASGAGTAFQTIGGAFSEIGGMTGQVLAFLFFAVLLIAALSSAISLLEVVTSWVLENTDYDRAPVTLVVAAVIFAFGIPSATGIFGMNGVTTLTWYNDIAYSFLLPVSVLVLSLFVGWVWGPGAVEEIRSGSTTGETFNMVWLWFVRLLIPIAVLFTLVLGIQELAVSAGWIDPIIELGG